MELHRDLRPPRGVALGTVLLCLTLLITLIFLAISASLSHLNVVSLQGTRDHATNLAEATLSRGVERLLETDMAFGTNGTDQANVSHSVLQDADGFLSFSPGALPNHFSTNNMNPDTSRIGSGGVSVPPNAVHLVARGRVGSVERWMECIYYEPPFPDGLVASGTVDASGLLLSGVRTGAAYDGGDTTAIPADQQVQANLFSLAATGPGGQAVILGPDCDINGSVGAVGQIEVDPSSKVRGEVRPGSQERPVPSLSVRDRIAVLEPNAVDVTYPGGDLQLSQSWFNHAVGGLEVTGDLDLNGSALTVDGPLTIHGAIKGTGAILVDGSVRILDGGSAVSSTDQVALAATGDVEIRALSRDSNYFQGLVYCEGDFRAEKITVVGAVTINGKTPDKGNASLENVRLVRSPTSVQISLRAMKGYEFGSRSGALSFTLKPAPDGETYICSARGVFTLESDIGADILHQPILWDDNTSDVIAYEEWEDVNVGKPGPGFGEPLATQIGQWARDVDNDGEFVGIFRQIVHDDLMALVQQPTGQFDVSFSLNNLLAEHYDESRILLWRPVER